MQFAPKDRPDVKLECLRMIATLKLDRARSRLISGFVDSYIRLTAAEQQRFDTKFGKLGIRQREEIMEIVTSWMEDGIKQGLLRGLLGRFRSRRLRYYWTKVICSGDGYVVSFHPHPVVCGDLHYARTACERSGTSFHEIAIPGATRS